VDVCALHDVGMVHGGKAVLDGVTLSVRAGAKVGVVGPNGAGKSTLLRIAAGRERPTSGSVHIAAGVVVGLLEQEPRLDEEATVRENVEQAVAGVRGMLSRYAQVTDRLGEAGDEQTGRLLGELGALQEALEHLGAWDLDARLDQAMAALRCPLPDVPVRLLSGGERRRVALCRLLLSQPDLLLLDEPTNHLDAESVAWLEQHLIAFPGAVMVVTHDRYFLDHLAQKIVEVDRGHIHAYEGNYSTYLETKAARLRIEGRRDAKLHRRLTEELAWARSGARGRQAKSRARLKSYDALVAEAQKARRPDFEEIQIPPGPRLGRLVVEADGLTKGYGDRLLVENLSFTLPRGGIVGVVGPNGVGKTTLFRMIAGQERPDAGRLRIGETVRIAYVDQARTGLRPDRTVWETVSDGMDHIRVPGGDMPSRAYVATFGFKGRDQQKPVGVLSGGEQSRLNLALSLKQGGNLLLLDEPTNDLDVETLASLENALLGFPGCVMVTAHDRWFLDCTATHILAWEGGAAWFWYEGNFADYEANKIDRLGAEAAHPHHTTHRRLARH
jgi:ATP-binding cassette ChvD family protein